MRLIDADALMEKANEHYRLALKRTEEAPFNDRYREQTIEREKFLGFIGNAPTIDTYTEDDIHEAIEEGHQVGYEMAKAKFERPRGEWIDHSEDEGYLECPICGCLTNCDGNKEELHYCWNCGADMRGDRQ